MHQESIEYDLLISRLLRPYIYNEDSSSKLLYVCSVYASTIATVSVCVEGEGGHTSETKLSR